MAPTGGPRWVHCPHRRGTRARRTGPTREDAAAALWAHLTSPLPPPSLGARARTRRRLRSHAKLARPMCPYSPTELARVSVVEAPASKTGARLYQAVAPDGVVLGFLWRSGKIGRAHV